jgi:hypothetical protein
MPPSTVSYHHGDLPAAPYRHFADRNALLSAVAAVGYRELATHLMAAHPWPTISPPRRPSPTIINGASRKCRLVVAVVAGQRKDTR